jgi:hypothetical protein
MLRPRIPDTIECSAFDALALNIDLRISDGATAGFGSGAQATRGAVMPPSTEGAAAFGTDGVVVAEMVDDVPFLTLRVTMISVIFRR